MHEGALREAVRARRRGAGRTRRARGARRRAAAGRPSAGCGAGRGRRRPRPAAPGTPRRPGAPRGAADRARGAARAPAPRDRGGRAAAPPSAPPARRRPRPRERRTPRQSLRGRQRPHATLRQRCTDLDGCDLSHSVRLSHACSRMRHSPRRRGRRGGHCAREHTGRDHALSPRQVGGRGPGRRRPAPRRGAGQAGRLRHVPLRRPRRHRRHPGRAPTRCAAATRAPAWSPAVGPNTKGFKEGDHVVFSFLPACGQCRWCASGHAEPLRPGRRPARRRPLGRPESFRHHHPDGEPVGQMCGISTFSEVTTVARRLGGEDRPTTSRSRWPAWSAAASAPAGARR